MTRFIDGHRARFGVEPVCRVLGEHGVQVVPSGYCAFKKWKPSKRALSDAALWERIEAIRADRDKGRGVVPPESWRASLCGFPGGVRGGVLVGDGAHHAGAAVSALVVVEPVAPVKHDGLGLAGAGELVS